MIFMMNRDIVLLIVLAVAVVAIAAFFTSYILQPSSYAVSIKMLSQSNSGSVIYPFEMGNFTVQVSNTGKAALSNMLLVVYLNSQQLHEYSINLQPGKMAYINLNYTYQRNGTYDFEAVADPAHVINILNRSATHSSVIVNVTPAELADVYTAVPNNGIMDTQSFSLSGAGLYAAWFVAKSYNVSQYNKVFGFSKNIMGTTLNDIYTYINEANGAYTTYDNGTKTYVAWLDGAIKPAVIDSLLYSFRMPHSSISVDNGAGVMFRINGTESLCVYYSEGWTKLLGLYNGSLGGNCSDMASNSYTPTQSAYFVSELKNNTALKNAQSKFQYLNSTTAGYLIGMNQSVIAATNMFANQFGLFTTSAYKPLPAAQGSNLTCYGLITTANSTKVCSTYILPTNGTLNTAFALINSQAIGSNYTLGVYSLVNTTYVGAAYQNAADLMQALNISQTYGTWTSAFTDKCSFDSNLPCSVVNFSIANDTGALKISNGLGSAIKLDSIACYVAGVQKAPLDLNYTVVSGSNVSIGVSCHNLQIPLFSAQTTYSLILNYTINNVSETANGLLNVTNFQA